MPFVLVVDDDDDVILYYVQIATYTIQMTLTPGKEADGVTVRATSGRVSFVLLAGEPIGEPVVQQGPVRESLGCLSQSHY